MKIENQHNRNIISIPHQDSLNKHTAAAVLIESHLNEFLYRGIRDGFNLKKLHFPITQ